MFFFQIANRLDRVVADLGRKPLKVLVQVNTSGEECGYSFLSNVPEGTNVGTLALFFQYSMNCSVRARVPLFLTFVLKVLFFCVATFLCF
jgi:hypothetical protein